MGTDQKTNLLIGGAVAAIFLYLSSFANFSFFENLEKHIYKIEMRLSAPRNPGESRVAIVQIDDKSIRQIGQWPWPRSTIADMIRILKNNGARLIGLDIVFSEREQNPGIKEIRDLYAKIRDREESSSAGANNLWILADLKEIEKRLDNDRALSETVKDAGNIILPVEGKFGKSKTELVALPEAFVNKDLLKGDRLDTKQYKEVKEVITPFEELSKSSLCLGHINISESKITQGRSHIPFINYGGYLIPSLPLLATLNYLQSEIEHVLTHGSGIKVGGNLIPTSKGEIFIKFKGAIRSFPYYSFADILKVKKIPTVFDGKIVLIGFTAQGAKTVETPVDPRMPRVEFMANQIESLLYGRTVKRSSTMIYLEAILLLLLTMAASFFYPQVNYLNRTGLAFASVVVVFMTSATFFVGFDTWFKAIYILLALVIIYAIMMGKNLVFMHREIVSKDAIETNRMLGISLQSQGLLDLAFEKFRKCPLDAEMRDIIYNLGLDYERKRMINKAISVYEYINTSDGGFRDLNERIPTLKGVLSPLATVSAHQGKKEEQIVVDPDMEIKPTVGRYEILMELGQGAMGTVYKGRDPKINRLLAIKTIRFSDEFEPDKVQDIKDRFFTEAELAGKLSHPGIVAIYDVGEDYDLTYMAMEFLEGENLEIYCKKGSLLPLRRVLDVIAETADALQYAHNNGVIHRDVKPGNIMLLRNGKIKVTDFGIAKSISASKTRTGIILGTPNYMSPEQIIGRQVDARSDIFSLGVVFFQLVTGDLPFKGENLNNLFYQITQQRHPSPSKINPRVIKPCEQIIDKCLAKNPDHRFQQARDLVTYMRMLANKIDALREQRQREASQ